jgi:hypothetical protein
MSDNTTITAIDGTDALAFVIIRPGKTEGGVAIEAAANGMSQPGAAYVLRHVANQWDGGGDDPSATLSALNTLAERYEAIAAMPITEDAMPRVRQAKQMASDIRTVLTTGKLPGYLAAAAPLGATQDDEGAAS